MNYIFARLIDSINNIFLYISLNNLKKGSAIMNCRIFNLSNSFMIYSVLSIFLLLFMSSGMIAQDYDVETKLLASDGAANDFFGYTVSISGNFAIIGAIGDSSYKGAAYIYFFNGSDWIQQQKLTANDGVSNHCR